MLMEVLAIETPLLLSDAMNAGAAVPRSDAAMDAAAAAAASSSEAAALSSSQQGLAPDGDSDISDGDVEMDDPSQPGPSIQPLSVREAVQQQQQQQSGQQQQQQSIQPGSGGMVHPGVVCQRHYPDLDVTELTLVNGLRVSLKHTDYFADEVVITALAVGGLSEVPRDGFYTASMSGVVSSQLGPFGHKPEVLAEMLAGRRVALSPSEGAYGRHVKGSASPHDLEATFQLLHLLFTQPPKLEPGEMDSVMVQLRQGVEAQQRNPLHAYHSRVRLTNYDCYFFEPITLQELDKVDLDAACGHHSSSFSNPSEFTLVLTGNTSLEALLPLVTRYLATIPAAAGRGGRMDPRQVTPLPFRFPDHPVVEDVEVDMVSPLTQCQITLPVHLDRPVAREQLWWLNSACKLLETRLLQKLRFEMGDLYTVSVGSFFGCDAPSSTAPQLKGDVSIAFTCDPANKGRLVAMALDTLQCLQEDGSTPDEIDTLRRIETFEWENMLGENSFWHDVTVNGYQSRRFAETNDLDVVWASIRDSRDKMMASMSCERLREVLCQLFPYPCKSRYTAITMMPRPPGLLGSLVFKWVTASSTTKAAVLAAGLAVVAAGVAAAVAARRRAAR